MQNQQPKDSLPLILPQAGHAKKGCRSGREKDELGDGLNLVNCGL
jgi:hypothetical protein